VILAQNQETVRTHKRRRLARELALRLLFQQETTNLQPEESLIIFEQNFDPKNDTVAALDLSADNFAQAWPLAKELFLGVFGHQKQLDEDIKKATVNWSLERMAPVDRALIRLAYYEMLFREDIPPKVSLNEALEIAKNYGDEDSKAFINGVLDKLLNRIKDVSHG
jgi:N utilization substance protein B